MTAWPRGALRFLRYNLVGVLGLSVKFGLLIALSEIAHLNYLWATALAVEAAVLHNFTWHLRWTWRDRSAGLLPREVLLRLLRFHLANGAVGMVVNLLMMWLLVERAGMHYLLSNAVATVTAGTANFLLSEFFVFAIPKPRVC